MFAPDTHSRQKTPQRPAGSKSTSDVARLLSIRTSYRLEISRCNATIVGMLRQANLGVKALLLEAFAVEPGEDRAGQAAEHGPENQAGQRDGDHELVGQ